MDKKNSINSQEDLIRAIKEIYGDKYDTSKTVFRGWNEKVTLTCHKKGCKRHEHGDFTISLNKLLVEKCGCLKCTCGVRYDTSVFIQKVKNKYGDYYSFEKN